MNDLLEVINENATTSFYTTNEAVQVEVAEKVLDKIFSISIGKYNKIDFSEIEKSRGDIKKIKFYKNLIECVNTLKEINNVTQDLPDIMVIDRALINITKLTPEFEKSFRIQNNCGVLIFNLIVYSIMEAVSYLIATSINFVTGNEIVVSNVNADKILISSLSKFNELAENGSIYKFISEAEKEILNESISETLISFMKKVPVGKIVGVGAISLALLLSMRAIVPLIRNIIYFIYKTKHDLSETAEVQANMLELNIKILKDKNEDPKIIAKQEKWVERFKKYADKFALDSDKAKRDSDIDIKRDKIDVDSLVI